MSTETTSTAVTDAADCGTTDPPTETPTVFLVYNQNDPTAAYVEKYELIRTSPDFVYFNDNGQVRREPLWSDKCRVYFSLGGVKSALSLALAAAQLVALDRLDRVSAVKGIGVFNGRRKDGASQSFIDVK